MIVEGNVIIADDGKVLTNGETYSKKVFLGIYDSVGNWHEIPEDEMQDEEVSESEALEILLGGAT